MQRRKFAREFKTERVGKKVYRTRAQARADVFDYIECFYSSTRRHSNLGTSAPSTSKWKLV